MSNLERSVIRKLEAERRALSNRLGTVLAKRQALRDKMQDLEWRSRELEALIKDANDKIINYNKRRI